MRNEEFMKRIQYTPNDGNSYPNDLEENLLRLEGINTKNPKKVGDYNQPFGGDEMLLDLEK